MSSFRGRLTVRHGKNGRSREIALHPSTVARSTLRPRPRRAVPAPQGPPRFRHRPGRTTKRDVWHGFDRFRHATGLDRETLGRRARMHDVRHSYVLRVLLGWYREEEDVEAQLPLLSTLLGMSIRPTRTGTSRPRRNCWRWPPSGSSGPGRSIAAGMSKVNTRLPLSRPTRPRQVRVIEGAGR